MKKNILLFTYLFISLFTTATFAQGEANYWYFGDGAGLNFETDPPTVLTDGNMYTLEGCASISSQSGDLLFYTDGNKVWNKNHQVMPNGNNLLGASSSTQSAVVVPHPGDPNLYYIFTTDMRNFPHLLQNGLNYNIVDLTLDNGNGDLSVKNQRLLGSELVPEKLTAVKHGNEPAFWIITHGWSGADATTFYVFKIDVNGLNTTPQTFNIGATPHQEAEGDNARARGYLKVSPDGTLLACAIGENPNKNIEVFDFNDLTGVISNFRTAGTNIDDPYGVEFSPDGTKMYATSLAAGQKLVQIDFANGDLQTDLSNNDGDFELYGALQISPHGVVYMATGGTNSGKNLLPAILQPDQAGAACSFTKGVVNLSPRAVRYGLPTFIQSFFLVPSFTFVNTCYTDETEFTLDIELQEGQVIDFVDWDFGDPASGASNLVTTSTAPYGATHVFSNKGAFNVTVQVTLVGGFSFTGSQSVTIDPLPDFQISNMAGVVQDNWVLCFGEQMQFKVTPWTFATADWSNNSVGQVSTAYGESGVVSVNVTNAQGCSNIETTNLQVQPEIEINFSIPNFCDGDGPIVINNMATPLGGEFTSDAVTFVDPDYILDPAVIPVGSNIDVFYEYTDAEGCQGTSSVNIQNNALPTVSLELPGTAFCEDATAFDLNTSTPAGGTHTVDGTTQTSINPAILGVGAHTVEYSYTHPTTGCSNTDQETLTINALPVVTFANVDPICQNSGIVVIDEGDPDPAAGTTGVYSGAQVDDDGNFDSNTDFGDYLLTYLYTDANGCDNSAQQTVQVIQEPQAATNAFPNIAAYCLADQPETITLECTGPDNSYVWYANDMLGTPLGNTKILTIPAPSVTTEYFVRSETNCGNSAAISTTVTIYANPVAQFSVADICEGTSASFTNTSTISSGSITGYSWDFGDGSPASTAINPTHVYNNYSTPNVTLTAISDNNCQHVSTYQMNVYDNPSASFTSSVACLGTTTQLTNASTAPLSQITNYDWTIEGNHYLTENIGHVFSGAGNFSVNLSVETEHGCVDNTSQQVSVNPLPVSSFTYFNPCRSNVVEITNTSTPSGAGGSPLDSFLWDYHNGETGTNSATNFIYIYPTAGVYSLGLTVTDQNGCSHTFTENNVIVSPDFDVSIASNPFCINVSGEFDGEPIPDFLPLDDYEWHLPDGTILHSEDISYTFTAAGNYTVSLVGTLGTCTAGKNYDVEVKQLPTPAFTYAGKCLNSPTQFTDESTGDNLAIVGWNWDFGDGSLSGVEAPLHTYSSTGNFPVQLTVTDANGCESTTSQTLTYRNLPTAAFNAQLPWCEGNNISFVNSSSGPGSFTGYLWDMGDGTSTTESNPIHSYPSGGDKTVTLQVTDDWNCTDTEIKNIFITPDFTLNVDYFGLCTNTPANLSGEVVAPPLTPDTWSWIFDDGTTATGQNTVHTFEQSGDHIVQLTASKNGCTEVHQQVLAVNPCPTANFNYSLVSLDDTVQFMDVSTLNGGPAIVSWSWDFGDVMSGLDNFSTLQNPKHLFTHLGDFDVTLTVTDANGCSDAITKTLTVNPRPVAGFQWDLSCFGQPVQFEDTSTTSQGFITDWWWDFGDPGSGAFNQSTAQNPTHVFTAPGVYDVQLVVRAYGYDTIVQQVTIYEGAAADFSFNNPCQGEAVNFVDESVPADAPIESWFWDFADGTTSTLQNPSHTYLLSGSYLVDLTVTDTNGCSSTITKNITIWQGPTAKFNYYSACTGTLTYFIDKSIADGAAITNWDWSFGDPISGVNNYSTEQNPSHEYTTPGTYEVILIVEDANGCVNSDTVNIIVEPSPVADFSFTSACLGESITFTDQSFSGGQPITSWYWEFGDGATSTVANPNHSYAAAGNYDVLLVVETAGGCSDEMVKTVSVFYHPTANFEWTGGIACENDTTHFTDLSIPTGNATIDTWFWQFGDGASSTLSNPDHVYQNPGTYAVNLLVTDINGCQNSITKTVLVSEAPVSNFTYNNSSCDEVDFTSTGFDPNGLAITSWYWEFGDPGSGVNNQSTQQNPTHQYVNGGTYTVTHVITNESGCTDTAWQQVVMSKPQADFSFTANCASFPVNFTDQSTAQGDPVVSWDWDFNDGNTSTQQNPSHIFATGGSYLVSLTVTTAGGCTSQQAHLVEVSSGPTANFIHTSIHCTSDSIQFTDVSTGDTAIVSWNWQFGDGTSTTLSDPSHAYALPGNYLVQLRVTDANGCYADKIKTLTIDQSPTTNFNWDIVNCDTTFFTDFTNPNGTTLIAWTWQFDDVASGVQNISFLQNPSHKFTAAGNYNVQLTVTNQHLCTDTLTRVVAYDAQPQPDFTFDTVCFGDSTHFTDLTPTNFQTIQGWEWKFGDNVVSHEQNPVHKYLAPGLYNVTLKVLNTNFCEDSIVKQVLVRALPQVVFSPDSSCFGFPVSFVDESISNADSIVVWSWDFGDGSLSGVEAPEHTYATSGTFQVTLIVENNFGCSNTATQPHYVNPLPEVDFTFTNGCLGIITQFTSQASSPVGIETYFWDFDDGTSATLGNPNHMYDSPGTYDVKLIVTDFFGCSDSITHAVEVFESPVAAFEAPAVCLGDSTHFTDLTLPAGALWNWSFGDGGSSTLSNPSHLYEAPGTYSVLLEVEDVNGCSSSVVQEVTVNPLPIVAFTWNFAACAGDTVFFEDLSQGIGTDIIGWNWDFGDGGSATISDPEHVYAESNDTTYQVTLIITTETGCIDSLTQTVSITGAPTAAFSFTNTANNGPCVGNQFAFTDESTTQSGNIQEWFWDFGDGASATLSDPLHYFENSGTFPVSLTVTNTAGCQSTIVQDIVVLPLPVVDFGFDSVCLSDTTHFNDSDFIEVLATSEWDYSFGDGASTTLSDPTHFYTTPGLYTVTLQITDTNLCRNQVVHEVSVFGLPAVDFSFDTACLFTPTHFTDLTQPADHELANWDWSFGDGISATLSDPEHVYPDFGVFTVKLIVSDAWGCTDSLQKLVEVYEPPVAHFTHSDTACLPGLVYFNDSSYHPQGHAVNEFLWTIDGFQTDIQNPQYTFPNTDFNYPVSLVITDSRGCTDTSNQTLYIAPELEISFVADTVCFGLETMLVAYSTKPANAEVRQWTWYFDDGSPQLTTTHDTIYHRFSSDGVFRVELQGNQAGTVCMANAQKNVKVRKLPMAGFTAAPAACADSTLFTEEAINSEGLIAHWVWYFGDGSSATIIPPDNPDIKHLYPPYLNTFEASLVVTNEFGCMDSVSHSVQRYPCIFVNFETDTNLYCQSKMVAFRDSSIVDETATLVSRFWDFGDASTSLSGPEIDTITHIYTQTGTFEITYVLTFDLGGNQLSDTARKTISVYPTPLAAIGVQNVCDKETALLVSNTNANNSIIHSWTWSFGDGQDTTIISSEVNNTVYHQYPQNGTFEIQLMVLTDLGCRDTAFQQITVHPLPEIFFIADTNALCGQGQILFTDTSKIETGAIVERAWSFGDQNTAISTSDTISHRYTRSNPDSDAAEYFTVMLTATSDSSCVSTDSIQQMVALYSMPRVAFSVAPDSVSILELDQLQLLNNTENAFYYEWLMNDTVLYSDSFEPNVWQDIQDTGTFQLQLFAQTVDGCWDSVNGSFKVYPVRRFFVPNAFSPNGNGLNETFGPVGKYFEEKTYTMKIFTRWGKLVFETKDFYKQWDGKDESTGDLQPIGVYAYLIEVTDLEGNVEVFKGYVTLVL